ncbi:hypothetical protein EB796_016970 [Bugula neritina]|uniref:Uncharacterized protein n=1 Tax=Bugula neritina TaxID=10212 RepID=A0A7J7JGG2_BUGNE|nr:hypothetical protein EB796_016970 [Bugula neritina]
MCSRVGYSCLHKNKEWTTLTNEPVYSMTRATSIFGDSLQVQLDQQIADTITITFFFPELVLPSERLLP